MLHILLDPAASLSYAISPLTIGEFAAVKKTGSAVLSREAALKIKELYGMLDENGRRKHTLMSLGKDFGVSETTVLRAIKGYGAFMSVPEPMPEMSQEETAASATRVLARAGQIKAPNPYAGFDGLSEKTLRANIGIMRFQDGRLTQEHVDEILAYRAEQTPKS